MVSGKREREVVRRGVARERKLDEERGRGWCVEELEELEGSLEAGAEAEPGQRRVRRVGRGSV